MICTDLTDSICIAYTMEQLAQSIAHLIKQYESTHIHQQQLEICTHASVLIDLGN